VVIVEHQHDVFAVAAELVDQRGQDFPIRRRLR
jgi:hypothetical protein